MSEETTCLLGQWDFGTVRGLMFGHLVRLKDFLIIFDSWRCLRTCLSTSIYSQKTSLKTTWTWTARVWSTMRRFVAHAQMKRKWTYLPHTVTWVSSPLELYVPGADECFGRCTACSTLFLPTDGASPPFTSVPRDTLTGPRGAMTQPWDSRVPFITTCNSRIGPSSPL